MTLEAQLLQIIEQQQQQLKKQQDSQTNALRLLQHQNKTIELQEDRIRQLEKINRIGGERIEEQQKILTALKNPQLLETLLNELIETYKQQLDQQLIKLVGNLNIDHQVKALLLKTLEPLVLTELEKQNLPLIRKLESQLDLVDNQHKYLEGLIQKISSRL